MNAPQRCGVTSRGGGCCRELHHPDDHCAHPASQLTGTPGVVVAGQSMLGRSFASCSGDAHPTGDRLLYSSRQGAVVNMWELIPPDEDEGEAP
jgi:hypothetical protein